MPTRCRLAIGDWGSVRKRQDGMAPLNPSCSKCSGPMQMKACKKSAERKRRSGFPERLRFVKSSPRGDNRRSVRANHPAPATAEIAAWRCEARTAIEAIATTAIEAAATAAPTTTATAAPATPAATTALCMRGSAAGGQHDGRRTDQSNTINRDKRRGREAAGQKVAALGCRLSHSLVLHSTEARL